MLILCFQFLKLSFVDFLRRITSGKFKGFLTLILFSKMQDQMFRLDALFLELMEDTYWDTNFMYVNST